MSNSVPIIPSQQKTYLSTRAIALYLQKFGFNDLLGNLCLDEDAFRERFYEDGALSRRKLLFFASQGPEPDQDVAPRDNDSHLRTESLMHSRLLITYADVGKFIDVEQIKEIYVTLKKVNASRSILVLADEDDDRIDHGNLSIDGASTETTTTASTSPPAVPPSNISLQALNALSLLEKESNIIIKIFHEGDFLDPVRMVHFVDWIRETFFRDNSNAADETPNTRSSSHHRTATATISMKGKPHKIISTIQMKGMSRNHFNNTPPSNRKRKNFQTKIRSLLKGGLSSPANGESPGTAVETSPKNTSSSEDTSSTGSSEQTPEESDRGDNALESPLTTEEAQILKEAESPPPASNTTTTARSDTPEFISDSRRVSMLNTNYFPFAESIAQHYQQHLANIPRIAPPPSQSLHSEEEIALLIDHFQNHVSPPSYLKLVHLHALQSRHRSEKKIVHNFEKSLHESSCCVARREFLRAKWKCSGRTINSRERRLKRMRRAATRGDSKAQLWLCKYLDDEYLEARNKKPAQATPQPRTEAEAVAAAEAASAAVCEKQLRKAEFWHWLWHAAWNGEPWAFCRIAWALENGDDTPEYIWKIDTDELRRRFLYSPMEAAANDAENVERDSGESQHHAEPAVESPPTELPQSDPPPPNDSAQQQNPNLSSAATLVADRLRRAVTLYELASSLNYNRGHYLLARCLKNLIGISKLDQHNSTQVLHRALDLLHFAASNQYAPAMNDLACLLIEADPKKAFELFQGAADLGLRAAAFNLGACLLSGVGTEVNLGKALTHLDWYHWKEGQISDDVLKKRVLLTDHELEMVAAEAFHHVALRYFNGNHVEMDKEKAVYYFEKSALKGNMNSQYKLALCYANGEGVARDREKAYYWYRKSAQNGHRESLNNLGVCLRSGIGCEKNEAEAVKCYKLASEKKNRIAAANLASCYENGIGVERDEAKAFYWYEQSAQLGYPKGLCALASYYENGIACTKDIQKAKQLYLKAAELGHMKAYHCLGVLYNKMQMPAESMAYFEKAARGGYLPSKNLLERSLLAQQRGDGADGAIILQDGLESDERTVVE